MAAQEETPRAIERRIRTTISCPCSLNGCSQLAASHPVTYIGKCLAGIMFLTGLMCVSIIGNALSERYAKQPINTTE